MAEDKAVRAGAFAHRDLLRKVCFDVRVNSIWCTGCQGALDASINLM